MERGAGGWVACSAGSGAFLHFWSGQLAKPTRTVVLTVTAAVHFRTGDGLHRLALQWLNLVGRTTQNGTLVETVAMCENMFVAKPATYRSHPAIGSHRLPIGIPMLPLRCITRV